ncbi:hypothetical protein [Desulfopila aestuarii]|uniref:hypothetical protein n=1 Tax=Desulfopila aestuarii TaxID=231440 RepID=UPI000936253F|nr:hypothetical protein [Desulfopila aestuarii]
MPTPHRLLAQRFGWVVRCTDSCAIVLGGAKKAIFTPTNLVDGKAFFIPGAAVFIRNLTPVPWGLDEQTANAGFLADLVGL